jgi:VWFA-related protein
MVSFSIFSIPIVISTIYTTDPDLIGFQLAGMQTGSWANLLCLGTIVGMLVWIMTRSLSPLVKGMLALPFTYCSLGFLAGLVAGAPLDHVLLGISFLKRIPFVLQPACIYLNLVLPLGLLVTAFLVSRTLFSGEGPPLPRLGSMGIFLLLPFLMGLAVMNRYLIPNLSFLVLGRSVGSGYAKISYISDWDQKEDGSKEHEIEIFTRSYRPGARLDYELTASVTPPAQRGVPAQVTVSARDATLGQDVLNLVAEDFVVREDGKLQQHRFKALIEREGEWLRTYVVLCLDVSGSMGGNMNDLRTAGIAFVEKLTSFQVLPLQFSTSTQKLTPSFTQDRQQLVDAVNGITNGGGTAIYDAVWTGLGELKAFPTARKVVVVFSDGEDTSSSHGEGVTLEELKKNGTQAFTIGFGKQMANSKGETALRRMADETGGKYFLAENPTELGEAFTKVLGFLSCQYSLEFSKPMPPPPQIKILHPAANAIISEDFTISAEVDRVVEQVDFLVAGVPCEIFGEQRKGRFSKSKERASQYPAGRQKIQVRVIDRFNREVEESLWVEFERKLPEVAIVAPQAGENLWQDGEFHATVQGAPFRQVTFLLDGRRLERFDSSQSPIFSRPFQVKTLHPGPHRFEVRAQVEGGEEAVEKIDFKVIQPIPKVRFSSPTAGAQVYGTVAILVQADSGWPETPLEDVSLVINEKKIISRKQAPYRFDWHTREFSVGPYSLRVVARNAAGQETEAKLQVELIRPSFSAKFQNLVSGQVITHSLHPVASIVENHPTETIRQVEFFLDEKSIEKKLQAPWRCSQDLIKLSRGIHALKVVAIRTDGIATEGRVQVDVRPPRRISVFFSAKDANGRFLLPEELSQLAIEVREDGRPCANPVVEPAAALPVCFGLVIDTSGSMEQDKKMPLARQAAISFIQHLKGNDTAFVIKFSERPQLVQDITYDRSLLESRISSLIPETSTALYDGVGMGIDIQSRRKGRSALIVLTDGIDQNTTGDGPGSFTSLREVVLAAKGAKVQIFTIGLGRSMKLSGGRGEKVLKLLSRRSGGSYAFAPSALALNALFKRVIREVSGQAKLTFTPVSGGNDGRWHDLKVSFPGSPRTKLNYKPGYIAN